MYDDAIGYSMRNASLYEAVKGPTFRLLNAARLTMERLDFRLPSHRVRAVHFKTGHEIISYCLFPDFSDLLGSVLAGVRDDPEFQAECTRALNIPEIAALCGTGGQAPAVERFYSIVLYPFVIEQLEARLDNVPDLALFDKKYGEFEKLLLAGTAEFTLFTPLYLFGMEPDEVSVGRFRIRKLTPIEVAEHVSLLPDPSDFMMILMMGTPRYGAEKQLRRKIGEPIPSDEIRNAFRPLLSALRLLHGGWTMQGPVAFRQTLHSGGGGRLGDPVPFVIPRHPGGGYYGGYYLRREEIPALETLCGKIHRSHAIGHAYWAVALDRFNDAVNRYESEEMLIDCWIACESLLGEDVNTGELSYRLCLRLAYLLECEPAKRSSIRQTAKQAYHYRSKIVHGSGNIDPTKLHQIASDMVEVTRRAIQRCIQGTWPTRPALVEELELSITGEKKL